MKLRVPFHPSSNPCRTLTFPSIMQAVLTYEKLRPPLPTNVNEGKLQDCCCCFFFEGGGGRRDSNLSFYSIQDHESFLSYHHPNGSAYPIQTSPCHGRNDSECFFFFYPLSYVIAPTFSRVLSDC